jgi:hypothetical protein
MLYKNRKQELGRLRLVLIEGYATKSSSLADQPIMTGRTDGNKRVLFPAITNDIQDVSIEVIEKYFKQSESNHSNLMSMQSTHKVNYVDVELVKGKYIVVHINEANGSTLKGIPLGFCTLQAFHKNIQLFN